MDDCDDQDWMNPAMESTCKTIQAHCTLSVLKMLNVVRIFELQFQNLNSNSICIHSVFKSQIEISPLFSLSKIDNAYSKQYIDVVVFVAVLYEHRMLYNLLNQYK